MFSKASTPRGPATGSPWPRSSRTRGRKRAGFVLRLRQSLGRTCTLRRAVSGSRVPLLESYFSDRVNRTLCGECICLISVWLSDWRTDRRRRQEAWLSARTTGSLLQSKGLTAPQLHLLTISGNCPLLSKSRLLRPRGPNSFFSHFPLAFWLQD